MSVLEEIKAKQIAEAEEAGKLHPYHPDYVLDNDNQAAEPENPLRAFKPVVDKSATAYPGDRAASPAAAAHGDLKHYQAAMSADLATLSTIHDVTEKAKAKVGMLATYLPFVNDYISKGDNYPNDIAVRVCIWLFDILDIERALILAFALIKQNQVTPPKFDRDLPTFVCDAMYDYANALLKQEKSASPYLDQVVAVIDEDQWSLAPPVHSKMYAMLGKHKKREGKWDECLALCEKAEKVNPEGAGVMTMKKEALAALAKLKEPTDQSGMDKPESTGDEEAPKTEQETSEPSE